MGGARATCWPMRPATAELRSSARLPESVIREVRGGLVVQTRGKARSASHRSDSGPIQAPRQSFRRRGAAFLKVITARRHVAFWGVLASFVTVCLGVGAAIAFLASTVGGVVRSVSNHVGPISSPVPSANPATPPPKTQTASAAGEDHTELPTDGPRSTASFRATQPSLPTPTQRMAPSSGASPSPGITHVGIVQGCDSWGENCTQNPIYTAVPPPGYDYTTFTKLATVDNGASLLARCWSVGGDTTNYASAHNPPDLGPNPYDSAIYFQVQAPNGQWGWIPDTYFVRDKINKMGLLSC